MAFQNCKYNEIKELHGIGVQKKKLAAGLLCIPPEINNPTGGSNERDCPSKAEISVVSRREPDASGRSRPEYSSSGRDRTDAGDPLLGQGRCDTFSRLLNPYHEQISRA